MELRLNEAILKTKQLTFRHEEEKNPVFNGVNLNLFPEEAVLILGPSGCGKSTLALCLNKLYPEAVDGHLEGLVSFKGKWLSAFRPGEINRSIGMVFQDPESQFCMVTVEDELAFGLENMNIPPEDIGPKIDHALELVNLLPYKHARIHTLSGGQKQKLALACVLSLEPEILILDEPTANLDPASSSELASIIKKLRTKLSLTLLIIEHKLDEWIDQIDRCLVLNRGGEILFNGKPDACFTDYAEELQSEGIWLPSTVRAGLIAKKAGFYSGSALPLNQNELIKGLADPDSAVRLFEKKKNVLTGLADQSILEVQRLSFSKGGNELLKDISFSVKKGEFIAIAGPNGSGKTTLSRLLSRLNWGSSGEISFLGRSLPQWKENELRQKMGYIFQNPEHQFITDSVFEEIVFSLKVMEMEEAEINETAKTILKQVRLHQQAHLHPFSLSQGQKRRLSVATMLVNKQDLLLLDEPTFGQDANTARELMALLEEKIHDGGSVIMVTHDMDLIQSYAHKVIILSNGEMIYEGTPDDLWNKQEIMKQASLQLPYYEKFKNDIRTGSGDYALT
ncbi:energy-coupling factor ABC transporter ATP-binding protein [Bacillus sp. ISL-47]|uniref:ABC transporter ATP-binding protein n=1 Tax=Bacillus sp. ISL-47 TaxID=2819130 RepID=UPI001BE5F81B|nr:ABC transporter ATP-binding protein [Bacillus sp. ISL-47]MBT2688907.1 energy-coupling factor ABC transporter ATP-binding protein [Bacillus sp. ISL-47]MBT2708814.1 energy-coupling factor ABC transporter ATP-binding protein [Pseudomonas sp. ISL-84]